MSYRKQKSNGWKYALGALVLLLVLALILALIYFRFVPAGRIAYNRWQYSLHKSDDATVYQTRKQVEDTCRAMIASYTADKLKYEQYASSGSAEQRGWGEQAKMRANQTAAIYNEYILKNSYLFQGNVPADIKAELDYLE